MGRDANNVARILEKYIQTIFSRYGKSPTLGFITVCPNSCFPRNVATARIKTTRTAPSCQIGCRVPRGVASVQMAAIPRSTAELVWTAAAAVDGFQRLRILPSTELLRPSLDGLKLKLAKGPVALSRVERRRLREFATAEEAAARATRPTRSGGLRPLVRRRPHLPSRSTNGTEASNGL